MDVLDIGAALKKSVKNDWGVSEAGKLLKVGADGKVIAEAGSGTTDGGAVHYTADAGRTDEEKAQARENIGAIQEPASEGTNGQVLTTDGEGGRSWTTVQGGGADADAVHYTEDTGKTDSQKAQARTNIGALGAESELPSTGTLSGDNILEKMTAAEFLAEVRSGTSRKLHITDYLELTLNGEYYDWGDGKLPTGHPYYSDTGLTEQAGVAASDLTVTYDYATYGHVTVGGVNYYVPTWDCLYPILTRGAKYYSDAEHQTEIGVTTRSYLCNLIEDTEDATFEIGDVTYHASTFDVHNSDKVTVSNAKTFFEIAAVNPYYRYGDSGEISGNKNHVMMMMRDCLPQSIKMRRHDKIASWEAGDYVGELTSSTTPNGSTKDFNFTKDSEVKTPYVCGVFVDGIEVDASNVTLSGDVLKVTFSAAPAAGSVVTCGYLKENSVWRNTAFCHTVNDPDLGVLPIIKAALDAIDSTGVLSAALFAGTNGNGMRFYGETRLGAITSTTSSAWANRYPLFLPKESEVWGADVYSALKNNYNFLPRLPIFENGRRRSKGLGNNGSRTHWWVGSPYASLTSWCYVSSHGFANINIARSAFGAALGFLFI